MKFLSKLCVLLAAMAIFGCNLSNDNRIEDSIDFRPNDNSIIISIAGSHSASALSFNIADDSMIFTYNGARIHQGIVNNISSHLNINQDINIVVNASSNYNFIVEITNNRTSSIIINDDIELRGLILDNGIPSFAGINIGIKKPGELFSVRLN
ncbi:MAG: hypothetical protein FWE37_02585 [Spirochaetaceae bacterium]|nr:hypothetical protein [Spirochaetaceae bacterium]